jgi:hypothetical protein
VEGERPNLHVRVVVAIRAEADLYEQLEAHQWNASTEIDWSRPIRNDSEEA